MDYLLLGGISGFWTLNPIFFRLASYSHHHFNLTKKLQRGIKMDHLRMIFFNSFIISI